MRVDKAGSGAEQMVRVVGGWLGVGKSGRSRVHAFARKVGAYRGRARAEEVEEEEARLVELVREGMWGLSKSAVAGEGEVVRANL